MKTEARAKPNREKTVVEISARRKRGDAIIVTLKLAPELLPVLLPHVQETRNEQQRMCDAYSTDSGYPAPTEDTGFIQQPANSNWQILGEDKHIGSYNSNTWGARGALSVALFRARAAYSPKGVQVQLNYPMVASDCEYQLREVARVARESYKANISPFAVTVLVQLAEVG